MAAVLQCNNKIIAMQQILTSFVRAGGETWDTEC